VESGSEVRRYLQGAGYPANKYDLMSVAESNDAPQVFLGRLRGLSNAEFSGPDEVAEALDRLKDPGRHRPFQG
jgi:hypothetical protein